MEAFHTARKKGRSSSHGAPPPLPTQSLPPKRNHDANPQLPSKKKPRRGGADPSKDRQLDSTIFVGDLDVATTSDHLKAFFQNFGVVTKVKVVFEQCYGFVTFESREVAEAVIASGKEGILMGERNIRVSWALGSLPEWKIGIGGFKLTPDPRKRHHPGAPPRRCKSRLFLSAVASAVASATAEAVIQGNGPGPSAQDVNLQTTREVIAYDDWL